MRATKSTPEFTAKLSAAIKTASARPEVKAKLSAAQKISKNRPEVKAKIAATVAARTEAEKAVTKAKTAATMANPEVRERWYASLMKAHQRPEVKARKVAISKNRTISTERRKKTSKTRLNTLWLRVKPAFESFFVREKHLNVPRNHKEGDIRLGERVHSIRSNRAYLSLPYALSFLRDHNFKLHNDPTMNDRKWNALFAERSE